MGALQLAIVRLEINKKQRYENAKRLLLKRRIINDNGCWLYTKGTDSGGYGQMEVDGRTWRVHRLSMFIFKPEEYKEYLDVLHKVICTSKTCFNPEHLYSGDASQNAKDIITMGNNFNLNKTHCPQGHEYNEKNTYISKEGKRACKICRTATTTLHDIGRLR